MFYGGRDLSLAGLAVTSRDEGRGNDETREKRLGATDLQQILSGELCVRMSKSHDKKIKKLW